jgi:hypothetical protein
LFCLNSWPSFFVLSSDDSGTDNAELCFCKTDSSWDYASSEGCEFRDSSLIFRHFQDVLSQTWDVTNVLPKPFKLDYVGPNQSIAKWGAYLELVDRILKKRDLRLQSLRSYDYKQSEVICCNGVCNLPSRKHNLNDLDRFKDIELYAFSTLCLNLMKWFVIIHHLFSLLYYIIINLFNKRHLLFA